MGTTRMTATNTFSPQGGMLLDFDPLISKDGGGTWSDALNATMLTFNGNERMMQQDMGNGRVETAYLPEGYVPLGTCEFGDIIYIVSYNPLENKCQLGCFPSPERNITSDEISEMEQDIRGEEFQSYTEKEETLESGIVATRKVPTGLLIATSVKKILYGNDNMNPGDKFLIYEEDSMSGESSSALDANKYTLTDYGNSANEHNGWPKLLKLNVVSIEDSGKIVDLNASVKWYDNNYYITTMHSESDGTIDLDSYRSLVTSAYSVFTSKVSGKLALLAELTSIDGFSCTYDVFTEKGHLTTEGDPKTFVKGDPNNEDEVNDYTKYKIYFYTAWENSHNDINPSGFLFTKSEWIDSQYGGRIGVIDMNTEEKSGNTTVYTYKYEEKQADLPVDEACERDEEKSITGFNIDQLFPYTVIYELGNDDDITYEKYATTYSYNGQIDYITSWEYKDDNGEAPLAEGSNYDKLSDRVTKVSRVVTETGEPYVVKITEDDTYNRYKYYYNLTNYSTVKGTTHYYSKDNQGINQELNAVIVSDDVINNYFHKDIPTKVSEVVYNTSCSWDNTKTDNAKIETNGSIAYGIRSTSFVFNSTTLVVQTSKYISALGTVGYYLADSDGTVYYLLANGNVYSASGTYLHPTYSSGSIGSYTDGTTSTFSIPLDIPASGTYNNFGVHIQSVSPGDTFSFGGFEYGVLQVGGSISDGSYVVYAMCTSTGNCLEFDMPTTSGGNVYYYTTADSLLIGTWTTGSTASSNSSTITITYDDSPITISGYIIGAGTGATFTMDNITYTVYRPTVIENLFGYLIADDNNNAAFFAASNGNIYSVTGSINSNFTNLYSRVGTYDAYYVYFDIVDESGNLKNDLSNLIWNYTVAPAMPYGVLDWLSIDGNIDFSKIGSGEIDLVEWRYYNSSETSTLTWGLECYPEPNKGIAEVVFDFYDNQGCCCSYHIADKSSFSGTFTESIVLGQRFSSYKITNVNADGDTYPHAGESVDPANVVSTEEYLYLNASTNETLGPMTPTEASGNGSVEASKTAYKDDSGTLYANMLYLVKITVKYCNKDLMDEYDTSDNSGFRTFYRWYYTNGVFNESYYNVKDFDVLQPSLQMDFSVTFDTNEGSGGIVALDQDTWNEYYDTDCFSEEDDTITANYYQTIGASVFSINQKGSADTKGNILMKMTPTLQESFNSFSLNEEQLGILDSVSIKMMKSEITVNPEQPSIQYSNGEYSINNQSWVQPIVATYLSSHDTDTGKDYSGYAKYYFGRNNYTLGSDFLNHYSITSQTSLTNFAEGSGNSNSSGSYEIYGKNSSGGTSSSAYQRYIDTFSLNIAGSGTSLIDASDEGDSTSYIDQYGNTVTAEEVPYYQQLNTNVSTCYKTGIPLCLTGVAFRKVCGVQRTAQATGYYFSPVLLIDSELQSNFHYSSNNWYFTNAVVLGLGRSSSDAHCAYTFLSPILNINTTTWVASSGTTIPINRVDDSSGHQKHIHNILYDSQFQNLAKNAQLPGKISAMIIAQMNSSGHYADTIHTSSSHPKLINSFFSSSFSPESNIYNGDDASYAGPTLNTTSNYSGEIAFNCGSGTRNAYCPFILDNAGNYTPLLDCFYGTTKNQANDATSGTPNTLANLFAALFLQLYAVNVSESVKADYTLSNIAYASNYSEYWNKDIVITVNTDNIYTSGSASDLSINNYDKVRDLLVMQQSDLSTYLCRVFKNSSIVKEDVTTNNIDIKLNSFSRTVTFQYSVPLSLSTILSIYTSYNTTGIKHQLNCRTEGSDQNIKHFYSSTNYTENTLYTWNESSETLIPFGSSSVIYEGTSFGEDSTYGYYMSLSSTTMGAGGWGTWASILSFENGALSFADLSSVAAGTWDIQVNAKISKSGGTDCYLSNIPALSLFANYKLNQ